MIAFRPATVADLVAVRPAVPRRWMNRLVRQISDYPAWTLCAADERLALCGLAPVGGGVVEAWFLAGGGLRRSRQRVAALRMLLMRIATILPDAIVICRIREGHRAGERMARLAGFAPIDEWLPGTHIRTWIRKT